MGKIVLYGFFYVHVYNFMKILLLNLVLINPFVGIIEM